MSIPTSQLNLPSLPVCCCCCKVRSVVSNSVRPHRRQTTRLPHPWNSQGKDTGVGCHFLLQCMEVKSESEVAQSCPTLSDPMDYSPSGSSVHGILQARVLEWVAIAFSDTYTVMYKYIYVYIHMYIHVCMYNTLYLCIHLNTYMSAYSYTYMHIFI